MAVDTMAADVPRDERSPALRYREYAPAPRLRRYVRRFWTLERNRGDAKAVPFSPVPDPYPGLVFQLGPDPSFHFTHQAPMPAAFLFGQTLTRKRMVLAGPTAALGVYLQPGAIKAIFGIDACEVADQCVDLEDVAGRGCGGQLSGLLVSAEDPQDRMALLSRALDTLLARHAPNPVSLDAAVAQILRGQGAVSVAEVARAVDVSERTLERNFRHCIGISPKKFSRICRFHAALERLRAGRHARLIDIAHDCGYSDQSHFIREFREFLGLEPGQFQSQGDGLFLPALRGSLN